MIEPLRIDLVVACSPEHAFRTWTERATAWWPPEHTMSHEPGAEIVFEPRPGGRVFERTPAGSEFEWGAIVAWEPPSRLAYSWHIATSPDRATEVEIRFLPEPGGSTRVEIVHGGWERLGAEGQAWRDANHAGWDGVLPAYSMACSGDD